MKPGDRVHRILQALAESSEGLTPAQISYQAHIAQASISELAQRLVYQGYATRQPLDGKRVKFLCTPEGQRALT